jgi:hypothetical protein
VAAAIALSFCATTDAKLAWHSVAPSGRVAVGAVPGLKPISIYLKIQRSAYPLQLSWTVGALLHEVLTE